MSGPNRLPLLLSTALAALAAVPVAAQEAKTTAGDPACLAATPCLRPDGSVTLDEIVISSTKTEQAPIDAMAGVSVVSPSAPALAGSRRVADLLQSVPGLTTDGAGDEAGAAINIRGLQDFGRVAVTVDGARQDFQQTTHRASGTFFLDPSVIERVTVSRGPIANVYGSGAIGGVVSFDTISPTAFLREGETWAVEGRAGFATNGHAPAAGSTGAVRFNDAVSVLGSVNYSNSHAYKDGGGESVFNSGEEIASGLGKTELKINDFNTVTASYLFQNFDYTTGDPTATNYDTTVKTNTVAARWVYDNPDDKLFAVRASGFWTGTKKTEERLTGTASLIGTERSYDLGTFGYDLANTSHLDTGPVRHAITVGTDLFKDHVDNKDTYGTGAFYTPSGDRLAYGAFLQDEAGYSDWLTVTGGLRFDGYKLSSSDDSIDNDGTRLSPKIAVGVTPFEATPARGLELYTSYAEGYRAPSTTETLISGIHPGTSNFEFRPNPDLKPETAHNIEVGVNFKRDDVVRPGDSLRLKAGYFYNKVDDYIDGYYGFDMSTYSPYYQYQNVNNATIKGFELEASYDAGPIFIGLAGAVLDGTNDDTGDNLTSIPAARLTTTVGTRLLDDTLALGAEWQTAASQKDLPAGSSVEPSGAYNVVNLFADYRPTENLSLGFKVKNLFDADYRPFLDEDNAPGRTFMFTLTSRLGG